MTYSEPELKLEARQKLVSILVKWELFLLAGVVVIGIAVGVQHDGHSGFKVALLCFVFLQPIFAWIVRDFIRILVIDRARHE